MNLDFLVTNTGRKILPLAFSLAAGIGYLASCGGPDFNNCSDESCCWKAYQNCLSACPDKDRNSEEYCNECYPACNDTYGQCLRRTGSETKFDETWPF